MNHVYQLNGRNVDQTVGETEANERANTTRGVHGAHVEGEEKEMEEDDKMEVDETPAERRARYMSSSQEAETHYIWRTGMGMTMKEWQPFPEPTDFAWRTRSRL